MYHRDNASDNPGPNRSQSRAHGRVVFAISPFGRLLKDEREAVGLSVADLAARCGVAPRTIEYLEAGHTQLPHQATRERLARGLSLVGPARRRLIEGPYVATPIPHNLPHALTTFVARTREQDDLLRLLNGRARRHLITLCGPGGIGKSRLALTVATATLRRFRGGVYLIDLTSATSDQWLDTLLANALEIRNDGPTALGELIIRRLRQQRTLLIFDNCEHLLTPCAAFIARLLAGAPGLQIIATSREPLGLPGEKECRLAPLPLPPLPSTALSAPAQLAALDRSAAVQLFVDRARLVAPDFRLSTANAAAVAAICRRLDGLPLAIELAASRLVEYTLNALASEIATALNANGARRRGVHERQRTVRATIDWSYALLNGAERALLRRLAVFTGSWTAAAAASVCNDQQTPDLSLLLASLVAKSLVQREGDGHEEADATGQAERFQLLQTVRQYALEQLHTAGEALLTERRLCDWAIEVLESVASPLDGGAEGARWLAYVDAELPNLRAARTWALDHDPERALRLISTTWPYAFARLGHDVGRYLMKQALVAMPGPSPWRVVALQGLGFLNLFNNLPAARRYLNEAISLAEQADDTERLRALRWQLAFACVTAGEIAETEAQLARGWPAVANDPHPGRRSPYRIVFGYVAIAKGDFPAARGELVAAIDEARRADQPLFLCIALSRLGALHLRYGHLALATENYSELLALAARLGSWFYRFIARSGLAHVQEWQGNLTGAEAGYVEALAISVESGGSRLDRATILLGQGRIALRRGQAAVALTLLEEGSALAHALNHRSLGRDFAGPIGFALWDAGQMGRAAVQLDAALAANVEGDPTTLARCLEGVAYLAIKSAAAAPAVGWFGAATALRAEIQMQPRPTEQAVRAAAEQIHSRRGQSPFDSSPPVPLADAIVQARAWLAQVRDQQHPDTDVSLLVHDASLMAQESASL